MERLIGALAAQGWTAKEFQKNHLEYVSHLHLGRRGTPLRISFEQYWRTVARISSILQREDIFHVIIKTRRNYPYTDTNVDVFVKDADSRAVRQLLSQDQWSIPSRAVILKQRMIEREKLKLPSRSPDLVPAHLYMSVSWRYQREVTFLEEDMVELVPIGSEAPTLQDEFGSLLIPMPTRAADILLHCAEIVFENYRLTLGEAIYLAWLLEHVPAVERRRIYRLGIERGAGSAMRCVIGQVRMGAQANGWGTDWPRNLTARELLASWGERLRMQAKRRRPLSGLEEWFGYAAFGSMYRVKRTWFE